MSKPIAAVLAAAALSGCGGPPETGFVELKRIAYLGNLIVAVNDIELPQFAEGNKALVKTPVGKASIAVKRGDQRSPLCEVPVGRNRIVSVAIGMNGNGYLACVRS